MFTRDIFLVRELKTACDSFSYSTLYVRSCTFEPVKINHLEKYQFPPLSIKFILD